MKLPTGDTGNMFFRGRRHRYLVRVVSAALLVTLVLLLTPCCEVFAAIPISGVLANPDTQHTHHADSDVPASGEHCAPWLSQTLVPTGDAVLPASPPAGIGAAPPCQLLSISFPRLASVVPHAGAPPPARAVYLLTSRLLL